MLVYAHASLRVKVFFENELVIFSSSKVARIFSTSVIVFSFKVGVKLKPEMRVKGSEGFSELFLKHIIFSRITNQTKLVMVNKIKEASL